MGALCGGWWWVVVNGGGASGYAMAWGAVCDSVFVRVRGEGGTPTRKTTRRLELICVRAPHVGQVRGRSSSQANVYIHTYMRSLRRGPK